MSKSVNLKQRISEVKKSVENLETDFKTFSMVKEESHCDECLFNVQVEHEELERYKRALNTAVIELTSKYACNKSISDCGTLDVTCEQCWQEYLFKEQEQ